MSEFPNATEAEKELLDNFVNDKLPTEAMDISVMFYDTAVYIMHATSPGIHRLMAIQFIHQGKDSAIKAWFKKETPNQ